MKKYAALLVLAVFLSFGGSASSALAANGVTYTCSALEPHGVSVWANLSKEQATALKQEYRAMGYKFTCLKEQ